uniref:MARVEL domain-containing protein n=1 Tax=Castor canadensis TaxID=51338 RepID=A0A8C0XE34_CASCN
TPPHPQPLDLLCLLPLLSTCVVFSLVASMGNWTGSRGNWSMLIWCFCFAMTFTILTVELGGLRSSFPLSWRNFPITCACHVALFCLFFSISYPTSHAQFLSYGPSPDHVIAVTTFSCIVHVAYAIEVAWTRAKPGEITGYMSTMPGLLKVLETFIARVIFPFIRCPSLDRRELALEWCRVVCAICFLLASLAILLNLGNCTNMLPIPFPRFLSGLALLSVFMYATALVLWPLYQFDEKRGGQAPRSRPVNCTHSHPHFLCDWDRLLAVTVLIVVNLLVYVADLGCSAHLMFVKV